MHRSDSPSAVTFNGLFLFWYYCLGPALVSKSIQTFREISKLCTFDPSTPIINSYMYDFFRMTRGAYDTGAFAVHWLCPNGNIQSPCQGYGKETSHKCHL